MRKKPATTAWPALNEPIREPSPRLRPHADNLEDAGLRALMDAPRCGAIGPPTCSGHRGAGTGGVLIARGWNPIRR